MYKIIPLAVYLFFKSCIIYADANVDFSGNLLDYPCKVDFNSSLQYVDFSEITTPQLNNPPGRSVKKTFSIKLFNCSADSIGKNVKITFSGEPETALPGALKVVGVNSGKVAIQIIDTDGKTPLAIGHSQNIGAGNIVSSDKLELNFSAYALSTPEALSERSVQAGDFSSVAAFEINYQ